MQRLLGRHDRQAQQDATVNDALRITEIGAGRQVKEPGVRDADLQQVAQAFAAGDVTGSSGGSKTSPGIPATKRAHVVPTARQRPAASRTSPRARPPASSSSTGEAVALTAWPVGRQRRGDIYVQLRGDRPQPGRPLDQYRLAEHIVQQHPQPGRGQASVSVRAARGQWASRPAPGRIRPAPARRRTDSPDGRGERSGSPGARSIWSAAATSLNPLPAFRPAHLSRHENTLHLWTVRHTTCNIFTRRTWRPG